METVAQSNKQMKSRESNQNLIIAGVAGLFTGGPIGIFTSPATLYLLNKAGMTKKAKWLTWAAIGIVGAPLSLVTLSPFLPEPTQTVTEATAPKDQVSSSVVSTQVAEPQGYGFGDRIVVGDRAITVNEIRTSQGLAPANQFAEPITEDVLLVRFTVENTGNESGNILFSQFQIKDAQGRTYDEVTDFGYVIWRDEQGLKERSSDLYPGEVRSDIAAFRVAPGSSGYTLEWKGKTVKLHY